MGASDKNKANHVRSAKSWLEKAEQSFEQQADIKGELNLMLAEAEMKNMRKNHFVGQRLLRMGAILTAVVLAAGIWYIAAPGGHADPMVPVTANNDRAIQAKSQWVNTPKLDYNGSSSGSQNAAAQAQQTAAPEVVIQETPAAVRAEQNGGVQARDSVTATHEESSPAPVAAQAAVMTDRQVQKAVQDAQHSLRGK